MDSLEIQKNIIGVKALNFKGIECYYIGVMDNNNMIYNEAFFRKLSLKQFSESDRIALFDEIRNRKSFVERTRLTSDLPYFPCFADRDDAEYIYDYIVSLLVMNRLSM